MMFSGHTWVSFSSFWLRLFTPSNSQGYRLGLAIFFHGIAFRFWIRTRESQRNNSLIGLLRAISKYLFVLPKADADW
ncbi:hypothetical protein EEY24_00770 (plasmid) [Shewanella algae]|nr:hypothetical protein EEY24_00770 [Shewanella algae]